MYFGTAVATLRDALVNDGDALACDVLVNNALVRDVLVNDAIVYYALVNSR